MPTFIYRVQMPSSKGGPNPSSLQQKNVGKIAAYSRDILCSLVLPRKSSRNGEYSGGSWGVYTSEGRGIIIIQKGG
jgi:hypothetical protein